MKKNKLSSYFLVGLAGIVVLSGPALLSPYFLMKLYCFMLFACAFNLLLGYSGLLSFGHAAYFGMASYATGHVMKSWGLSPELGILVGVMCAALMGVIFGWIAIRRHGIYFSMITLALAQMVYFFCLQAPFTHGEEGIQAVPRGRLFGLVDLSATMPMYYFVAVVTGVSLWLIWRIVHSPFGRVLESIKENEPRAISLGYRTNRYKLLAFVLSATLAGVAGSLKVLSIQLASLTDVYWHASGEVVLMSLLGGMNTVFGPAVGAAILVSMQTYLAQTGAWITIIQGAIFLACVLMFRRGIVGEIIALSNRITAAK